MSGVPRLICPLSFIGSPPGADFDNSFGWSIGAVYAVAPPFSVFAFLDGSTAIAAGQDDPLELRVGAEFRPIKALKLTGSVMKGCRTGRPIGESPPAWPSGSDEGQRRLLSQESRR